MSTLPTIVFLLCNTIWVHICEIKATDVTFEELNRLDITCNDTYTAPSYCCQERRMLPIEELKRLTKTACHCDSSCSLLGTCCLDSSFQEWSLKTEVGSCRTVQNKLQNSYFLIDKCPYTENTNDAFKTLCEDEHNAEDDLMSRLPVTSLSSNLSYKNYFCFRCHESNDDCTLWNVELTAVVELKTRRYEEVNLTYNKASEKWFASDGGNNTIHPVSISIEIPEEIRDFPKTCPQNLISSCSVQWPQDEIREKCGMYMFVIWVKSNGSPLLYKNPHCALCNFEDIEEYNCMHNIVPYSLRTSKKPFSFSLLLKVEPIDKEKVGEIQRCDGNSVWDPFFKKCRKLLCVLRGYTIKDGKCRPA